MADPLPVVVAPEVLALPVKLPMTNESNLALLLIPDEAQEPLNVVYEVPPMFNT